MKPSTKAFIKEARRTSKYGFVDFLHGYIYMRWPYFYIGVARGTHPLARFFKPFLGPLLNFFSKSSSQQSNANISELSMKLADGYHGKVVPFEEAARLVTVDRDVCMTDLEKVIPYASARDIILKNPDHIMALDCPCRDGQPNPCQPVRVCIAVGEPFASFVTEHHAGRSQKITAEEAIEILRGERDRGHVHHAFFKDAMLNRFYAICNCCKCCCGAMNAHLNGTPMLASSGYVSHVTADKCPGCDICAKFCQFGAINLRGGAAVVDESLCMGCGVCAAHCPADAISLIRQPAKGEPLKIRELMAEKSVL